MAEQILCAIWAEILGAVDAFCFFNKLIKHDLNTFVSGRKQHVKQMLHIEQLGFEVWCSLLPLLPRPSFKPAYTALKKFFFLNTEIQRPRFRFSWLKICPTLYLEFLVGGCWSRVMYARNFCTITTDLIGNAYRASAAASTSFKKDIFSIFATLRGASWNFCFLQRHVSWIYSVFDFIASFFPWCGV